MLSNPRLALVSEVLASSSSGLTTSDGSVDLSETADCEVSEEDGFGFKLGR